MATQIAALNVKLLANVSGFAAGMKSAVAPLKNFGSHVASIGSKVVAFGGALTAVAAGAGMVALVKSSFESIDATAKLADRLGLTTEQITSLSHAANLSGISQETLAASLGKMLNVLGEAATKATPAGAALAKLGLDAATLANQAPDAAFRAIAEGISQITNPAERAAVAVDIFGKSGQELLPLMLSGAAGIAAAQAEAEKLGLTFSRLDAAKVEAANDSMSRLQAVFTGVSQTLAIELAPYVDALATKIVDIGTSGEGMSNKVSQGFGYVVQGVAKAADYLELLKAGFYAIGAVSGVALLAVMQGLQKVVQGVEYLSNKLLGTDSHFSDTMQTFVDDLENAKNAATKSAQDSLDAFMTDKNSKAAAKAFNQIQAAADASAKAIAKNAEAMRQGKIDTEDYAKSLADAADAAKKTSDAIEAIRNEFYQTGMSDTDKKLMDLSAMGAGPEQMAEVEAMLNQMDAFKQAQTAADKLQSDAASVFDATRSPMEKYEAQIGKLNDLLDAGTLEWDAYGRAVRDARADLESATKVPEVEAFDPGNPTAMKAGSAQAQRYLYDMTAGSQRMAKDEIPKRQLQEQQDGNRILERIEHSIGNTVEMNFA